MSITTTKAAFEKVMLESEGIMIFLLLCRRSNVMCITRKKPAFEKVMLASEVSVAGYDSSHSSNVPFTSFLSLRLCLR